MLAFPYAKLITGFIRSALVKCGKAFAVSNYLRQELLRTMTIDVRVSYSGVDLEEIKRIRPATEINRRFYEPATTIVYAGGLEKFKGIFELLDGFRLVLKKMSHISLLIAGDGPYRKAVQKFIEVNRMKENVVLLGALPHEPTISAIKASGMVIVPSLLPEGGSRVIMEALACGKPVLASNRGANPEMVGDAGITFSCTPKDIAQTILRLLRDKQKIEEMSHLARRRSLAFSLETTRNRIVKAYEDWLR